VNRAPGYEADSVKCVGTENGRARQNRSKASQSGGVFSTFALKRKLLQQL